MATLDPPPALSQRVINALKADPKTVDLRAQATHFYALGARILELFEEDGLADVLIEVRSTFFRRIISEVRELLTWQTQTFKKRAAGIADHAHNPRGALGEGVEFLRGLDETERQLFRAAHDSAKATKAWAAELRKT